MAVMLPNIMKNLFSRPETRLYPAEERILYPHTRGHIEFDADKCNYCTLCSKKCPADAIKVDRANKTWILDSYRCIVCAACVEDCPKEAIQMIEQWRTPAFSKTVEVYEGPKTEETQPEA
jgi:ech hydrogenase subunit F